MLSHLLFQTTSLSYKLWVATVLPQNKNKVNFQTQLQCTQCVASERACATSTANHYTHYNTTHTLSVNAHAHSLATHFVRICTRHSHIPHSQSHSICTQHSLIHIHNHIHIQSSHLNELIRLSRSISLFPFSLLAHSNIQFSLISLHEHLNSYSRLLPTWSALVLDSSDKIFSLVEAFTSWAS